MITLRTRLRTWTLPRPGQAMVETALILPIFLLVVFAVLDLGRVVFLKAELENAVREGVRAGLVNQPFTAASQTLVRNRVQTQAGLANATVVSGCTPSSCAYGSRLTVSATLPVTLVAGMVPALPSPNITASASVRIE